MNEPNKKTKDLYFWPGIILVAIGVPGLFWLRFGKVDGFAIGFTAFLLLLLFAIQFIPKLNAKYGEEQAAIKVKPGRFDWLGAVWLLAIPLAPFLAWVVDSLVVVTVTNWKIITGIKIFLCIVIPFVSVLPLLRYLRGKAAPYALLILVIGTGFPITFGVNALLDFSQGLKQETVQVSKVFRVHGNWRAKDIVTDILEIELADGRTFEANVTKVEITEGTRDIVFLAHQRLILASN